MAAFLQSGHFFPPLTERNEEWRESRDGGVTFASAPAPYMTNQLIGVTGTQRFETTYTIPATANGTYSVTVQGDIYSNEANQPAHVFLDGVDQGIVATALNDFHGPKTFTFPSLPGVHTFSLRIGANVVAGTTAPHIGVTYKAKQPCCCILNESPVVCFKSNNIACFPVSCSDGIKWYFEDGVQLTPDDLAHIVDCKSASQGLRLIVRSIPSTGGFCDVSPAPDHVDGFTLVGSCWIPNAGVVSPVMEWDGPISVIDITAGRGLVTGGHNFSIALANEMSTVTTVPNPVIWPLTVAPLVVGETRLSNLLPNGHRIALVYVAGPNNTNAPRPFAVTSISNYQELQAHGGIANTDQIHFRLIYM